MSLFLLLRSFGPMSPRSKYAGALLLAGLMTLVACSSPAPTSQRQQDANTPAGKLGQAAHKAVVQADKGAKVVGRELDKAAHDARAGWNEEARKEAARKDQARK